MTSSNVSVEAEKHLRELGAFEVPNPTLAKAIAMRRLMDAGIDPETAQKAIEEVCKRNR